MSGTIDIKEKGDFTSQNVLVIDTKTNKTTAGASTLAGANMKKIEIWK